jgi:hypothetical protein
VEAVGNQYALAEGKGCRRRGAVGRGGQIVELAGDHQHGNVRIGRVGRRRASGRVVGRSDGPVDALVDEAVIQRHAAILIDGERRVGIGKGAAPLRKHAIPVHAALRRRERHVEDLCGIMAHHHHLEAGAPLGDVGGGIARILAVDAGDGFGHQPQQGRAVVFEKCPGGGVQVADRRQWGRAAEHGGRESRGVEREAAQLAVIVEAFPGDRLQAQLLEQGPDMLHGASGNARATGRAAAGEIEFIAHRGRIGRIPRVVRAVQRISAVEHDGAQQAGVAEREHLLEISAVRIAVQVDLALIQRRDDGSQIIGRRRGAEERRTLAQQLAAGTHRLDGPAFRLLQFGAVERAGLAGAAIVHDEHVPGFAQRLEQCQVLIARLRGGIAGAALGRHQKTRGFPRRRVGVELEVDRQAAGYPSLVIERPVETAAIRDSRPGYAGATGQRQGPPMDRGGRPTLERQGERRQQEGQQHPEACHERQPIAPQPPAEAALRRSPGWSFLI